MSDYASLRYVLAGHAATITFDRPDKLNAFTTPMLGEFNAALDRAEQDGARVVLLTGAGRAFCSGSDLEEMSGIPPEERDMGARLEALFNPLLQRLADFPVPIVAAVNGVAAGSGFGIALAADIVIAARSAFFLVPFTKIGLVPDVGITWNLPRAVGKARATGMMLLAERVPAEKAEAWGLIWQAVDDEALAETAGAIVRQLAEGPTVAFARTRRAIHEALQSDLAGTLALERRNQQAAGATDDHREGLAAFHEKRRPEYRGR